MWFVSVLNRIFNKKKYMKLVFIYKKLVWIELWEIGVYEVNRDNCDFMFITFVKNMYKTFVLVV